MLIDKIQKLAAHIWQDVVQNRRHLHRHPELSFQEYKTAAFIKDQLDQMGIPYSVMADTGVVAVLQGHQSSDSVVALRADIDALPITETNEVEYKSCHSGIMHACGHDVHTASLLGVARILQELKEDFGGTVKLIFQPAEELLPGGAAAMIREGVLQNPAPGAVLGQHTMPLLPSGKISIRPGSFMASMDELYVTVHGKGGHGAQPHQNIDPVLIASHIIVALQQVVSRAAHPKNPTVLSFGKFIANGSCNVIPDQVVLEGTFRALDETWRAEAHRLMQKMATGIAEAMGGQCEFNIRKGYPSLHNNEALTHQLRQWAGTYLGAENVVEQDIWMAAEDFAYYAQQVPSCFYLLGTGNVQQGITSSLHTPTFNIDETALQHSTGLMAYLALRQLGNE